MKKRESLRGREFVSLFLIITCTSFVFGKTIYVDASTPDSNNGTSWDKACSELQQALILATYGDQIRVADGTYLPDYDVVSKSHTGSRTATFTLKNGVAIYGGYAGYGAEEPNECDPNTYLTFLSGDLAGNDSPVEPNALLTEPTRGENSYHIVTGTGTNSSTILEGFTISGGNANTGVWPDDHGAGIFNSSNSNMRLINCSLLNNSARCGGAMINHSNSNPTITNCSFINNFANDQGGGIENYINSRPVLTDCSFGGNEATHGGGVYNYMSDAELTSCFFTENAGSAILNYNANPTIIMCSFNSNSCVGNGAAIHDNNSNPEIIYCDFTNNTAQNGGGIHNQNISSPVIEDCNFAGNTAVNGGGGGMSNDNSSPQITNCIFRNNSAGWGGGMNSYNNSTPTLTDCNFIGNYTTTWGAAGMDNDNSSPILNNCSFNGNSSIWDAGGMGNYNNSSPQLTNCIFANNTAKSCGGMDNSNNSNPVLNNCQFRYNSVSEGSGAMLNYRSNPILQNCTFTENHAAEYGGAIANYESNPTLTYCNFNANTSGSDGGAIHDNNSSPIIIKCNFNGNAAGTNGGAIFNYISDNSDIEDCNFINNSSENGGGGIHNNNSSPSLNNCVFSNNSANWGGGMDNCCGSVPIITDCNFIGNSNNGINNNGSSPVLNGCIFSNNSAEYNGGGVSNVSGSHPVFTICSFNNNTANERGGAIYDNNSNPNFNNCSFNGNTAQYSGGIDNYDSDPNLTNCTFNANIASVSAGGMTNVESNPRLANCAFLENTAQAANGGAIENWTNGNAILIGCIFNGNTANQSGGAINNYLSNPTIQDCNFTVNNANVGGGIANYGTSNPVIADCNFANNTAINTGGGIYNSDSNPQITGCNFNHNSVQFRGGAIYNISGSNGDINDCTFKENSAASGGGAMGIESGSNPDIRKCIFTENTAQWCGAIYANSASPNFINCDFIKNNAIDASGAIELSYADSVITNCRFLGNIAQTYNTGALTSGYSTLKLINCVFTGNHAPLAGGALNSYHSIMTLINCSVVNNYSNKGGGLICTQNSLPNISNCIFWGNSGGPFADASPVVRYSCIQDSNPNDSSIYPGTGNIDDNPMFVDADGPDNIIGTEDDNLRLQQSSPCIDTGTNTTTPPLPATDLDGQSRIQNGIVNMGVYEGPTIRFNVSGSPVRLHEGESGQFHVSLTFEPDSPLEVIVAYQSGSTEISVTSGSTLYFDSTNYNIPQPVTLTAADGNYTDKTTIFRISANGVPSYDVTASIIIYATMAVSPFGSGMTNPSDTFEAIQGEVKTLTAGAAEGYYFSSWTAVPPENASFTNLNSSTTEVCILNDVTITANFGEKVTLTMAVSPEDTGSTTPAEFSEVIPGQTMFLNAQPHTGYYFASWTAMPPENAHFSNPDSSLAEAIIYGDVAITANFAPLSILTMTVFPENAGTVIPSEIFNFVPNTAQLISAAENPGYKFLSWTAVPAENVSFFDDTNSSTTAILYDTATITANFNTEPNANIKSSSDMVILDEANSITLYANESSDDGLPNPPAALTYHWQKISGPNTCIIKNPDDVNTLIGFGNCGTFVFGLTVFDGQLDSMASITIDVLRKEIYVSVDGNDVYGDGTISNPFASIEKGINTIAANGTAIVLEGTYYENVNFGGKNIILRSTNPDDPNVVTSTIIDANGSGSVFVFDSNEDANSVVSGFTITDGNAFQGGGIYIHSASPTIEKNIITDNYAEDSGSGLYAENNASLIRFNTFVYNEIYFMATVILRNSVSIFENNLIVDNLSVGYDAGLWCDHGRTIIKNNTIAENETYDTEWDSSTGILLSYNDRGNTPIIINNIIGKNKNGTGIYDWGDGTIDPNQITYNNIFGHLGNYFNIPDQTGINGNISCNPLFADSNNGDFHLASSAGRWDSNSLCWASDAGSSPCIDAGDPNSNWSFEMWPHGKRINMGAYGNTAQASMSASNIGIKANLDNDEYDSVNFIDFELLAVDWQKGNLPAHGDINRNSKVDIEDLAIFVQYWLYQDE